MWPFFNTLIHNHWIQIWTIALAILPIRLISLTALEKAYPAHFVSYRQVLPKDLLNSLLYLIIVLPIADHLDRWTKYLPDTPVGILAWPLALRVVVYLVVADLLAYWVHRLLHTVPLWPAHKWHHYPTSLYWCSGVQGSVIQQALSNLPYVFAAFFLGVIPSWVVWILIVKSAIENDFMHLNVRWGYRWLEWVLVTPRYHHIHHSERPEHYQNNLGVMLSIWDRLFGTYYDPEAAPAELRFGINEKVSPVRLVIGV
jgi:sterol desaturase/sphingolipid hydroxylase (fatty acid hydroxylase superfamily)